MIAIVDYKAGNLTSVVKALSAVGVDAVATEDPDTVLRAEKIVLPGVGHFAATKFLDDRGLRQAICERIGERAPFLGICVGMQWLFSGSMEAPGYRGLGVFDTFCERFENGNKVPHVGWNSLEVCNHSRLMAGVATGSFVYYSHSYRAPIINGTVAVTNYGETFTAVAENNNVMGVQFHPEKSGAVGLRILRNFAELPC